MVAGAGGRTRSVSESGWQSDDARSRRRFPMMGRERSSLTIKYKADGIWEKKRRGNEEVGLD